MNNAASPSVQLLRNLIAQRLASRIWARETTPFAPADAPAALRDAILNRLGWLTVPKDMSAHVPALRTFAEGARRDGIRDVYLLGMGGSSLCAEVLRLVPAPGPNAASLTVLDTTDERTIRDVTARLNPKASLFLVSSKSGTTTEVWSLERHFRATLEKTISTDLGSHFAAITDPGTPLAAHALDARYRHAWINPPDIGGRFSVLSLFGLVPAALLDLDLDALLASAQAMASRCASDAESNPGLALGAFIGDCASRGCDKLTVLFPSHLGALGLWIEQLIAESTGKEGRGLLPVVDEPFVAPASYGHDRAFVVVSKDAELEARATALETAGHPVFRLDTSTEELGAAFFQWEFATAVAGSTLHINPFDEPNVAAAKKSTQSLLDAHKASGTLPIDPPFTASARWQVRSNAAAKTAASGPGRYVAILDYCSPDAGRDAAVARVRQQLIETLDVTTTHGFGPRYLHSTGQYHKGGPNTGTFLIVTAADATSTPVPQADYSFSVLKQAQALGDFATLTINGRRVVHVHLTDASADLSGKLVDVVDAFVKGGGTLP